MKTYKFEKKNFRISDGPRLVINEPNKFINDDLILYPLYKKLTLPAIHLNQILPYYGDKEMIRELYCPTCNNKRMFTFEQAEIKYIAWEHPPISTGTIIVSEKNEKVKSHKDKFIEEIDYFSFYALADCGHHLVMDLKVIDKNTVQKIGQYPSIYEMNENINNKEFLTLLDKEYQGYYKTACSQYSFGASIGAMTYLRRIFEKLLIDTFNNNFDKNELIDFTKKRMEDKVKHLKDYLPNLIQEQGFCEVYSLISDGIHNLTEDECQIRFNTLKLAIEEILIEDLKNKEAEKRKEEIKKQLQSIKGN